MKSKVGTILLCVGVVGVFIFVNHQGWLTPSAVTVVDARPDRPQQPRKPFPESLGWKTDWENRSIDLSELHPGGPPRDGIPPIDNPKFLPANEATELAAVEPLIAVTSGGKTRGYPLRVLIWHEIVNDSLGGVPICVTYCPLCNAAIVFHRTVGEQTLTFGTSGLLRKSDLVMWDRQTETLWQQASGKAVIGSLNGQQLTVLPSQLMSVAQFKRSYGNAEILSQRTKHDRPYGNTPYVGYDQSDRPFLYRGPLDNRLRPTARVLGLYFGNGVAYSYAEIRRRKVINSSWQASNEAHNIDKTVPYLLLHQDGKASAMNSPSIASGRDVGTAGAFDRRLDGKVLTFSYNQAGELIDAETGSKWRITGHAYEGPLKGKRLQLLPHVNHFWFAWHAFFPQGELIHGSALD